MTIQDSMKRIVDRIGTLRAARKAGQGAKTVLERNLAATHARDELFSTLVACTIKTEYEQDGEMIERYCVDCQALFDRFHGSDEAYRYLFAGKKGHKWAIFARAVLSFVRGVSAPTLKEACEQRVDENGKPAPIPFPFDVTDRDVQQAAFEVIGEKYGFGTVSTKVVSVGKATVLRPDHPAVVALAKLL